MKWLRGLFRRKRKGLPEVPDSPENWSVGDMAECIHSGPWYLALSMEPHENGPAYGDTRIVARVAIYKTGSGPAQFLGFARWGNSGFAACEFRKITPRADETGIADADFVRKWKRVQA